MAFRSSSQLAAAYGLAVTGTLLLTSALFLVLAREVWRVQAWKLVVYLVLVVSVELTFLGANLTKVVSGGWLPLVIAAVVVTLMTTWRLGAGALHAEGAPTSRGRYRPSSGRFATTEEIRRVPGVAVFPHPNSTTTPSRCGRTSTSTACCTNTSSSCRSSTRTFPTSGTSTGCEVNDLGDPGDGFVHVSVHVGFTDSQDIPKGLALAIGTTPELDVDLEDAYYFLSVITVQATGHRGLRTWRQRLYAWMYHNAANRTEVFHLPPERTVVMGAQVEL